MTATIAPEIRPLRGVALLRALQAVLPLGRKYHPLLAALNGRRGLAALQIGRASCRERVSPYV